jgi:hypothetical protein
MPAPMGFFTDTTICIGCFGKSDAANATDDATTIPAAIAAIDEMRIR